MSGLGIEHLFLLGCALAALAFLGWKLLSHIESLRSHAEKVKREKGFFGSAQRTAELEKQEEENQKP